MRAPIPTEPDDLRSIGWLCEMAAVGCDHRQLPAWASQLRADAARLLRQADAAEGRRPAFAAGRSGGA